MKRCIVYALSLCLLLLSSCGDSESGKSRVPYSNSDCISMSFDDVLSAFQGAGFTNISTKEISSWESRSGKVSLVSVDGHTVFNSGSYFAPDAPIVITYYVYEEPEPTPEPNQEPTSSDNSSDSGELSPNVEASRADALAVDLQFRLIRASMEESYYTFLADVKGGTFGSELESYNAAKVLKEELQGYYLQLMDVKSDGNLEYFDDYRLANYTYVSEMITVAEKSMQYFDDGLTSTLSEFQEAVSLVSTYYDQCYLIQDKFLNAAGFSFDEIDTMLGNLDE